MEEVGVKLGHRAIRQLVTCAFLDVHGWQLVLFLCVGWPFFPLVPSPLSPPSPLADQVVHVLYLYIKVRAFSLGLSTLQSRERFGLLVPKILWILEWIIGHGLQVFIYIGFESSNSYTYIVHNELAKKSCSGKVDSINKVGRKCDEVIAFGSWIISYIYNTYRAFYRKGNFFLYYRLVRQLSIIIRKKKILL